MEPDEDKTSETVEWEMTHVLYWLKQTYTEENDSVMVNNVTNYSRGFWKGLFTCYDHYFIPRTNNDLEQFFRRTVIAESRAFVTGTATSFETEKWLYLWTMRFDKNTSSPVCEL
ncbi:hypothetical protein [Paenibacillus nasutitermitis]|uniref:Uncharacterized protein n=1 Tax=Paenibacillus nasutitermitis TaxID=1652958 RepID=A0A916YS10_9BACL|nr:hypothetical protein [Paenibacillus nasutitermitis]GGD58748.1 hypothetical protein GCM10010911_15760 [Paenibacillus nasutitermitis]